MTKITQSESGKAFEYALAQSFSKLLSVPIEKNKPLDTGKRSYNKHEPLAQRDLNMAADKASIFLKSRDGRIKNTKRILLQSDQAGGRGDVRDVILRTDNEEIGISAKQRHDAIKHSRLSDRIDFGKNWMGCPCSKDYFEEIAPIFDSLRQLKKEGKQFSDILDKDVKIYGPILTAFVTEMRIICSASNRKAPESLFRYLLGREDFYWIIKKNGDVSIQSYNTSGVLEWGHKLKMPREIKTIDRDDLHKLSITFDAGWQLSFRLHSASKICEPSLKFDIRLLGVSSTLARHEIKWEAGRDV